MVVGIGFSGAPIGEGQIHACPDDFRRVWNRRAQRVGAQRLTPRIVANIVKAGGSASV